MNGDEPAFPNDKDAGLTKREYYAAKAMQAIIASPAPFTNADGSVASTPGQLSAIAFLYADAMIAAGSKKEGEK